MLYDNKDMSKLPLDVEAKILPADKLIDECQVADQALLIMEMKIYFDDQ